MFNENIEIIHVYGDLGELKELSDSRDAREYAERPRSLRSVFYAINRINIIGRHEKTGTAFEKAYNAIRTATFVAILGYGFDQMNNENLRLREAVEGRHPFSTGYRLGCGGRARLASLADATGMIMGGKTETVRMFLEETDFLRWINEPSADSKGVTKRIRQVFNASTLPYQR